MQKYALLAFDVDATLFVPVPVTGTFAAWEAAVQATPPEPLAEALDEVALILAEHPRARRVIITGRHERLRDHTEAQIAKHYPQLADAFLSMTSRDDESPERLRNAAHDKLARLAVIRTGRTGGAGGPMLLVDDDPGMAVGCGAGDCFVRAWEPAHRFWLEAERHRLVNGSASEHDRRVMLRRLEERYRAMRNDPAWTKAPGDEVDRAIMAMSEARTKLRLAERAALKASVGRR